MKTAGGVSPGVFLFQEPESVRQSRHFAPFPFYLRSRPIPPPVETGRVLEDYFTGL